MLRRKFSIIELDDIIIFIYIFIMLQVVILNIAVINFNVATEYPMTNFRSDVGALVAPYNNNSCPRITSVV
jgi:hypothetical protein